MSPPDPLKTCLLDILFELRDTGVGFLLGGGYGLFLKQLHLQRLGAAATLFPPETWPDARATNDLDVFPRAEIATDSRRMAVLAKVLSRLGFVVKEGYEYLQFIRTMADSRQVKIDLLVGPLGRYNDPSRVKVDERRVKAIPSPKLHAHPTPEAIAIESEPTEVPIAGTLSDGVEYSTTVPIPQAFPYLMMKLLAFRDAERRRPGSDKALHHAIDLYRVVAMTTQPEYTKAKELRHANRRDEHVVEAVSVVRSAFSGRDATGVIRIREHSHFRLSMDLDGFVSVLTEVFLPGDT